MVSGVEPGLVSRPAMVREHGHGTDRRAFARRGVGGAVPGGARRDRGTALPGDLAAGAGPDLPRSGRGAGVRAALAFAPRWRSRRAGVRAALAFAPRWVEGPAARYNASGPDALGDRRRRNGRIASLLTPALLAALAKRVRRPPDDDGPWTAPKAAAWMARRLGLAKVHPQRGWEALKREALKREALKRIEWSIQAPRPRNPRAATPEERAVFNRGSAPRSRGPRRPIPAGRSRSGPRTS